MTDDPQLKQMHERIRELQAEALNKWRPLSGVTHNVREAYKSLEANLSKATQAANSTQYRVEQLRDDDTIYPEGRARLIREAIAKGKAEVAKHQRAADACVVVIKANLTQAAIPRMDPQREAFARDELRVRLDGAVDPVAVLFELASRDDEMGAVACSSYAESWMRAHGVADAPKVASSIRGVAAESASQSADPARRAVGVAHAGVSALDDALVTTGSITHTALEAADGAALAAGVREAGE